MLRPFGTLTDCRPTKLLAARETQNTRAQLSRRARCDAVDRLGILPAVCDDRATRQSIGTASRTRNGSVVSGSQDVNHANEPPGLSLASFSRCNSKYPHRPVTISQAAASRDLPFRVIVCGIPVLPVCHDRKHRIGYHPLLASVTDCRCRFEIR